MTEFKPKTSREIETFAHANTPYTPGVWGTIATGLGPEEHGITGSGTSEWSNPVLEFVSRFTGRLSEPKRGTLGRFVRDKTGERELLGETDSETIFDDVPESVFELREWIEEQIVPSSEHHEEVVDIAEGQLRDLGYI